MDHTKIWHVDVYIGEHDGRTHAEARLRPSDAVSLTAKGEARLNPKDADVPEIGDELAVARALADLSHRLLDSAADDIEGATHKPVHLTS